VGLVHDLVGLGGYSLVAGGGIVSKLCYESPVEGGKAAGVDAGPVGQRL